MTVPFAFAQALAQCLEAQASTLPGFSQAGFRADVRMSDVRFGDFQANGVLAYAKQTGQNPRQLALQLVQALSGSADATLATQPPLPAWADRLSWRVDGPGFINISLADSLLKAWLYAQATPEALQAGAANLSPWAGKKVLIDYSSPNTAKQMHVGHLRSMVIGEALQRLLRFGGAQVIRDNHLGDWGTQFGILLMMIERCGIDLDAMGPDPLQALEALYKEGSALTQHDPQALEAARKALVALQQGDEAKMLLWQRINQVSYEAFESLYQRFGVQFDLVLGESFYRDQVQRVYTELQADGLAHEDQGALVVFHPEHERFRDQPFMVRKSDGASNYASTDLATVLYRSEVLNADACLYVTDARQQDHFEQLFLTTKKWFGKRDYRLPELRHLWFGTILGSDGKAIKTRSGQPIRLQELADEAVSRARALVAAKNPDLEAATQERVAQAVGLGAIRYADLSQNRSSDYTFEWDKLLAFDGNTAPYLLYAIARVYAIFRRNTSGTAASPARPTQLAAPSGLSWPPLPPCPEQPESLQDTSFAPEERLLARHLVGLPSTLELTLQELRPHYLCTYLYELAGLFSSFYNAHKVLVDDTALRQQRLLLCHRSLVVLATGAHLLGLEVLEQM